MPHLNLLSREQFSLLSMSTVTAAQSYANQPSSSLSGEQVAALFPNAPMPNLSPPISSIPDQFPAIKPAILWNICAHSFNPDDLYTLDPQYARRVSEGGYATFGALFQPLTQYFRVLVAFAATSGDAALTCRVSNSTTQYLAHLVKFDELYQWPAVLAYHMAFHRKQLCEMVRGEYGGWADIDGGLHAEYLFGKEKAREEDSRSGSRRRRGKRGGKRASLGEDEGCE